MAAAPVAESLNDQIYRCALVCRVRAFRPSLLHQTRGWRRYPADLLVWRRSGRGVNGLLCQPITDEQAPRRQQRNSLDQ